MDYSRKFIEKVSDFRKQEKVKFYEIFDNLPTDIKLKFFSQEFEPTLDDIIVYQQISKEQCHA